MRVLIINTSERTGGAAVAASRLMKALNNNGVKAKMLVRDKETDSLTVAELPRSPLLRWHFLWERFVVFCRLHFSRQHLDHARHLACYSHLSSDAGLPKLHHSMPEVPALAWGRLCWRSGIRRMETEKPYA